jgi:4'-phosphopantetheinyl transferase
MRRQPTTDNKDPLIVVRWIVLQQDSAAIIALRPLLDASEHIRAERFRVASDRDAFIAAHALLRTTLSDFTGAGHPAAWRFQTNENGKPSLDSAQAPTDLHFSLSHTRGLVACAVGQPYALGIDAEAWRDPAPIELAARYFAPDEVRLIGESAPSERAATFYRLWTLKESYLKATGQGLATPLDSFAFSLDPLAIAVGAPDSGAAWHFVEIQPSPVHSLALAVRSPQPVPIDAAAASLEDYARCLDRKR